LLLNVLLVKYFTHDVMDDKRARPARARLDAGTHRVMHKIKLFNQLVTNYGIIL